MKSADHSAQKNSQREQLFPRIGEANEPIDEQQLAKASQGPSRPPEHEDSIKEYVEANNPYSERKNKIPIDELAKNKCESDQNSESALTAEQTEKQHRSEQLLERLANVDKKVAADPYAISEIMKKSGKLSRVFPSGIG